jgi:hypothetical protein
MKAPPTVTIVKELGRRYSNWGRWGESDELGTLNHLTPRDVVEAAGLVRTGRIVAMGLPIDEAAPNRAGRRGAVQPDPPDDSGWCGRGGWHNDPRFLRWR